MMESKKKVQKGMKHCADGVVLSLRGKKDRRPKCA